PDAAGVGFGDVDPVPVGGEADAVRGVEREEDLANGGAVGAGVEDARPVALPLARGTVIGEPEATRGVEHQVVRAEQAAPVAAVVETLPLSGVEMTEPDAAAGMVGGRRSGNREPPHVVPGEAATVVG